MPRDMRSLSEARQQALRIRAVTAVATGKTQSEVARVFGVTRASVNTWVAKHRRQGEASLSSRARGRPPLEPAARHGATLLRTILSHYPDQLGLPAALWTWEAVQRLLAEQSRVVASRWTVHRYLAARGLRVPTVGRRPDGPQTLAAIDEIRTKAQRSRAALFWIERRPLEWVLAGAELRRLGKGRCGSFQAWIAVNGRGEHLFGVHPAHDRGEALVEFLRRLRVQAGTPVLAVITRGVRLSPQVRAWLRRDAGRDGLKVIPGP